MSFDENNRTLVLNTKDSSDYVLVISNAEKYKELGYTASIAAAQQQTEPSETGEQSSNRSCSYFCDFEARFGAGDCTGRIFGVFK